MSDRLLRVREEKQEEKAERRGETTQLHFSQAFTIVELLIVIVVIAILAAITIVSYTGISAKAKDAALSQEASQLLSVLRTNQATNGSTHVVSMPDMNVAPTSIDEFLTANNLTSFKDKMCVNIIWRPGAIGQPYVDDGFSDETSSDSCWPEFVEGKVPQFDKAKLYVFVRHSSLTPYGTVGNPIVGESFRLAYSYYSNQQNQWIYKYMSYGNLDNPPGYEEEGVDLCSPRDEWGSIYDYNYDYSGCEYWQTAN